MILLSEHEFGQGMLEYLRYLRNRGARSRAH